MVILIVPCRCGPLYSGVVWAIHSFVARKYGQSLAWNVVVIGLYVGIYKLSVIPIL